MSAQTETQTIDQITRLSIQHEGLVIAKRRQAELVARIAAYERQFGMRSEEVHAAIDRGELEETLDVCHWLIDYDLLCRVKAK